VWKTSHFWPGGGGYFGTITHAFHFSRWNGAQHGGSTIRAVPSRPEIIRPMMANHRKPPARNAAQHVANAARLLL